MTPPVLLAATLVLCTIGLTALFWGLALTLQGLLYNEPADRLPLRSLVAGLLVSCFITCWTYANTRASHADKYGTLFEFNPTAVLPVDEIQAIRWLNIKDENGQPKEATASFKWVPSGGPNGGEFVDVETNKPFARASSYYVTIALEATDITGQKKRFSAPMKGMTYTALTPNNQYVTFFEQGGTAFITDQNLHKMEVPSTGAFVLVLGINVIHFVIWLTAFWPITRFRFGHALLLTSIFGSVTMFILMPLLFNKNAVKPVVPARVVTPAPAPQA